MSRGHGDISVHALKLFKCVLAPILSDIINDCLCFRFLLEKLKQFKVVPIFKL